MSGVSVTLHMSSDEDDECECVVCLDDLRKGAAGDPIWQCSEGHVFCSECFGRVGGPAAAPCPSCSTPLGSIRNRMLEKQRDRQLMRVEKEAAKSHAQTCADDVARGNAAVLQGQKRKMVQEESSEKRAKLKDELVGAGLEQTSMMEDRRQEESSSTTPATGRQGRGTVGGEDGSRGDDRVTRPPLPIARTTPSDRVTMYWQGDTMLCRNKNADKMSRYTGQNVVTIGRSDSTHSLRGLRQDTHDGESFGSRDRHRARDSSLSRAGSYAHQDRGDRARTSFPRALSRSSFDGSSHSRQRSSSPRRSAKARGEALYAQRGDKGSDRSSLARSSVGARTNSPCRSPSREVFPYRGADVFYGEFSRQRSRR